MESAAAETSDWNGESSEQESGKPKEAVLLEVMGTAKFGPASSGGASTPVGQFGGSILFAGVFGNGFTVGPQVRIRHVEYFDYGGIFSWGFSGMFGGTFARNLQTKHHHTVLGGLGLENLPSLGLLGVSMSAQYTASLGGFGIGPALDFLFFNSQGISEFDAFIGLNIGYAGLL